MIVVTVGTNEAPFDRLLQAIDSLDLDERLVVQHGASTVQPRRAECVDYLPFDDLVELVRGARVVVTHAGVGSIMVALANGTHPVVIPRLRQYGEAVDDHQVGLAKRLGEAGLVTLIEDLASLPAALGGSHVAIVGSPGEMSDLALELRTYLRDVIGTSQTASHNVE